MIFDDSDGKEDLGGIFLFFHGASKVEGLAEISGELHIIKSIRKIVGPYLPIAIVDDSHENNYGS